jgi:hypothetical protein
MAQTGFTPIKLYYSPTAAAVPLAANLAAGELALNTTDGKLYYKTTGGVVTLLAGATAGPAGGSNTQVQYNSSGSLAGSANLTFDGSNLETYSTVTARASSGTSAFRLRNTTSDYQWQTVAGTNAVVLYDNAVGSGRVTLDSTGNLGIGTSSPGSALEVKRTSGNAEIAVNYNDTNKGRIVAASNGNVYIGTSVGAGAVVIGNTANADAVTLLSSGNLGIGTSSPGAKLDVAGASKITFANGNALLALSGGASSYTSLALGRTTSEIYLSVAGTANNFITGSAAGDLTINNNTGNVLITAGGSATQLYLNTSGNLGLGVTPSAWGGSNRSVMQFPGSNAIQGSGSLGLALFNNAYNNGTNDIYSANGAAYKHIIGTAFQWFTAPSGTAGNAITFTQAMTLNAGGGLSVGTTTDPGTGNIGLPAGGKLQYSSTAYITPEDNSIGARISAPGTITMWTGATPAERVRVDVNGNVGIGGVTPNAWSTIKPLQLPGGSLAGYAGGAGNNQIGIYNNAYFDGSNYKYTTTDTAQRFVTIGGEYRWYNAPSGTAGNTITFTQAMTLNAAGNLVIGTASAVPLSGGQGARVMGYSTGNVISASQPAAAASASFLSESVTAGSSSWYHFYGSNGNGSLVTSTAVVIYGSGDIENANNSYGAYSDIKLKENIADATPKLDKLMQVKVRSYNLKDDQEKFKQIGVIAQELEEVFPGMVSESPDRDKEGVDIGTTTKSVKYSVFVPMLIKAIQEQQTIIQSLTDRVTQLEAKA